MNYRCHDIFMVRTPTLPIEVYKDFDSYDKDSISFLNDNEDVSIMLKEGLLISSQSIYKSIENIPKDKKKLRNLEMGIRKYLTRMSTRPTPYGLFAGVALGKFAEDTNLRVSSSRCLKDVKVDTHWILQVIHNIESDIMILTDLNLKWNDICYTWGSRVKNPYFSNHGVIIDGDIIEENSIRYTNLIEIIRNSTSEFISFRNLKEIILENYEDVPEEIVDNTILNLVENEYLLTDLRIPAYCDDTLQYVIDKLKNVKNATSIRSSLENINSLIQKYKNDEGCLKEVYKEMKILYSTSNYIEINKGLELYENTLSTKIRTDLEKFVNILSYLYVKPEEFSELDKFKKDFVEEYGLNVRVPLIEIIDSNCFNGLAKIGREKQNLSAREAAIKGIIDRKIIKALMAGEEEAILQKEDFEGYLSEEIYQLPLAKSFDMNFFIVKKQSNIGYRYVLGPNGGASKAGKMFQRFMDTFDKGLKLNYNKIYEKEINLTKNEYEMIEARETAVKGRVNNVINRNKNHNYYINIACDGNEFGNVLIADLSIALDYERKLYIFSERLGKKCKIVSDNMLNSKLGSKLIYLLKSISDEYEGQILSRAFVLYENVYNYVPRIVLENVILSPRKWKFSSLSLKCNDFNSFKSQFQKLRGTYSIDQYIYQCESDNRLLLNLNKEYALEILYAAFKKSNNLELCEVEPDLLKNPIVSDEHNRKYVSECTFSFIQENEPKDSIDSLPMSSKIVKENQSLGLAQDGWIYMKIYGLGTRANEFLLDSLQKLLATVKVEKWFFIRYADPNEHIRLRLKFRNKAEAIRSLTMVTEWEKDLKSQLLLRKIEFDTYLKESNRYGGADLISTAEDVFHKDSMWVLSLLSQFDLENKEDEELAYFVGIVGALRTLTSDMNEMLHILDVEDIRQQYRKEYTSKRSQYYSWIESIFKENLESIDFKFAKTVDIYQIWQNELVKYKDRIEKNRISETLTNSKEGIISSTIHMFCNRLEGNVRYENKYRALIRHALFDLVRKQECQK